MTDSTIIHHRIRSDDEARYPSFTLFATATQQLIFVLVDSGLSTSFHITRGQAAELIAALRDADNELAAREVPDAPQEVIEGEPHYFHGGAVEVSA